MQFDTQVTDELLATTRAVRKRLDLDKAVPRDIIQECLELAVQAPTGSNSQGWRWIVVDDPDIRAQLADLYRKGGTEYLTAAKETTTDEQTTRVYDSAMYLLDNLQKVPVHVIPCIYGRPEEGTPVAGLAGLYGSIFPAVWNFQLALRSRGLGSVLTTLHLIFEAEAAKILGIPEDVMQVALLPVAYTKGLEFKRAKRPPIDSITHWNQW